MTQTGTTWSWWPGACANAFGLQHHPEGRLFATEDGIYERSAPFIIGDPDDFYEVTPGTGMATRTMPPGRRLDDPHWGDGGRGREPVIAESPGTPPEPYVSFNAHAAANGFDFAADDQFGFAGDAFVACSGDADPVTTRRIFPAGFKVVRIDMARRKVVDFAVNRIAGGAGILPHNGFERPSTVASGPTAACMSSIWAEMVPAPERGGVEIRLGAGPLWRIRRTATDHGELPPKPLVLPLNLLRAVVPAAGAAAVGNRSRQPAVALPKGRLGLGGD